MAVRGDRADTAREMPPSSIYGKIAVGFAVALFSGAL
jgi:hypothetical protein